MLLPFKRAQTSIILRVKVLNSSVSTGAGLTGLAYNSSGLVISTIADNEAAPATYTAAGGAIETIATLGAYAAPATNKCRFKEVDATNHPGVYEIQLADARYAVSGAKSLLVSLSGATNMAQCDVVIPLWDVDPYDPVRGGMSAPVFQIASAGGWTEIAQYETVHFQIITHDPLTGALADADAAPTWKIWGQTGDTPCGAGSFTKREGYTGHYRASFDVHPVNGFDPGEFFEVVAETTVGGVAEKIVVMNFRVLAPETAEGKPAVDAEAIADTVLSRDMSEVETAAPEHSLCTIVLAALESSTSSTQWIIKRTDGTTTHVTKTVTTDADAEPITGVS
jgi:hypothetical protein